MTFRSSNWVRLSLLLTLMLVAHACFDGTTVCEYTFVIRRWRSMTYTSPQGTPYSVELNGTQLQIAETSYLYKEDDPMVGTPVDPDDVITADGYIRDLITINDEFPGPTLHVMSGDTVVVHVHNMLQTEAATIHWHGMKMLDNPWMDGVPWITQCPIQPRQKFTYRFKAEPHGTHWYHSHLGIQRADGLFGMLVIHPTIPKLTEFTLTLNEWFHHNGMMLHMQSPWSVEQQGVGDMTSHLTNRDYMFDNSHASVVTFKSALINGRGRYQGDDHLPLEEFHVTSGERYYFRLANTGTDFGFDVSIDNHKLQVVSLDGEDISPIKVDSFIIYVGETVDFEVIADQPAAKYWLRAVTLRYGSGLEPKPDNITREARAIVTYDTVEGNNDPVSKQQKCTTQTPCHIFNCPFKIYPTGIHKSCIFLENARSVMNPANIATEYGLNDPDEDVIELFYNFGLFTSKGVDGTINSRVYVNSRTPLYADGAANHMTPCDERKCDTSGCVCTNIQKLPYNKTVQLVMTNLADGHFLAAHHAIHLHSHNFAVLKTGRAEQDPVTGLWVAQNPDIACFNENKLICSKPGWAKNRPVLNKASPPLKNTVTVPIRGYTVVRFRTTTPGYWFLHCHMEQHFIAGMGLVFNEAPERHPPPPKGFPACGDSVWLQDDYERYLKESEQLRLGRVGITPNTSSAPFTTTTTAPLATSRSSDKPKDENLNSINLDLSLAIGVVFGLLFAGALLPLVAVGLYVACAARSKK